VTDVIEDVGTITATWTDPTGTVWPLSDTSDNVGWFTTPGPAGWDATTYEIVTDPLPRGGEQLRFIRSKPGSITWPIYVWGDTHLQYVQRHRQIKRAFTMTLHRRLPGTLRVARPDSSAREIDAYYSAGLEGEAGDGWLFAKNAITLFCPDGYWRDVAPVSFPYSYVPGSDFLNPFPTVSAGLSLGETTINNPGDVTAWPVWTITGPISSLSAISWTTGRSFSLNYGLSAGEQIVITTLQPSVRGPAGQNLTYALNWPDAQLWWLEPDDNLIDISAAGAAPGTTVQLDFHPRYEGA
jgi:hypothetical protein